jgi:hypothetical protein
MGAVDEVPEVLKSLESTPPDSTDPEPPAEGPGPASTQATSRGTDFQDPSSAGVVFVSHSFAFDPAANGRRVTRICRTLTLAGHLPLAPQIYLPQFISEATERDLALRLCLRLVALADEVRVYGEPSAGMIEEIAEAERLGIPVVLGEER